MYWSFILLYFGCMPPTSIAQLPEKEGYPNVGMSRTLQQGWTTYEKDMIAFCAASVRNTLNSGQSYGHIQVAAMITMDKALTSAAPLEVELRKYANMGIDLVLDKKLMLAHNQFDVNSYRMQGKKLVTTTFIEQVIFYPYRKKRATVDSPAHTRDDLAVLKFTTITPPEQLCRCHINFIPHYMYFPSGYVFRIAGYAGRNPFDPVGQFPQSGYAIINTCSTIAKYWGYFFCVRPATGQKGWNYGPDSGAPVFDLNLTVVGIGSFAFRMKDDQPSGSRLLGFVTNLSHIDYRKWIMEVIYNEKISDNSTTEYDIGRASRSDCNQWHYNKWEDLYVPGWYSERIHKDRSKQKKWYG